MENEMIRRILLVFILTLLCTDLYGQRRGDKGRGIMDKTSTPDEDYDYKVDSAELRDWLANASKVYLYGREMLRGNKAIQLASEFDKDKDRKLSSKESLEFKSYIKPIFEKATQKLLLENDANKNRRLDKSELIAIREKVPNFLYYALENHAAEKEEATKKLIIPIKKPEKKRSITDIYN